MQNEPTGVSVAVARAFKRHLRALSKKYHHVRSDIQPAIETIQSGEFIGDRITGTEYVVFKVREEIETFRKGRVQGTG
jgi:mRNA-degrading endonuclease RelE of RelBE toxin-antitoxin system